MITSASNNRIKEARKLQRRRERHDQGVVLLEGVRLIRDAWEAGAVVHQLFYAPEIVAAQESAQMLIEQMAAAHVETFACSVDVFSSLSETVTPQGVAATVALPNLPVPVPCRWVLLLDQVRDPGNAGTLLRSAAAAGVDLVLFGPETVDPFNEKVLRAGMGAHFRLPLRVLNQWDEMDSLELAWMADDVPLYVADAAGMVAYDAVDWSGAAMLAVGGEANGASAWVRQRATAITIPMQRATESLNAAVAGSVILFEAARQRRFSGKRTA